MFFQERKLIALLAASARLPAVYGFREHVDAGGLISYGVNLADNFRRAATYVVKILKGAKPGDLAVEFPNKLELIINLKISKALGGRPFADTVRADRRGDRIEMPFAAAHESVVGTKRTCSLVRRMSVVGGRTDLTGNRRHFRVGPIRDIDGLIPSPRRRDRAAQRKGTAKRRGDRLMAPRAIPTARSRAPFPLIGSRWRNLSRCRLSSWPRSRL
jgi:hypothetical protein